MASMDTLSFQWFYTPSTTTSSVFALIFKEMTRRNRDREDRMQCSNLLSNVKIKPFGHDVRPFPKCFSVFMGLLIIRIPLRLKVKFAGVIMVFKA